ncbi:MAG: MotA/TolQ/ExbB proton channel family protein, partial [Bacteriovoracaceae bacterium]
ADDTAIGRVAETGLMIRNSFGGEEQLQARMDEVLTEEISRVDKRTQFLSMFGNVATLLGLLGTVTGLIASFAGIAAASPMERATLLGQGISEALNSTAFGLVAAIPALIAFAIFQNKTDQIINHMTEECSKIYHDLLFHVEGREVSEQKSNTTSETRPQA